MDLSKLLFITKRCPVMRKLLPLIATLVSLLALQSGAMDIAVAQNMDMAVAQKWASAKVVKYRVEGVHNGREAVVYGDYEGKAEVIDRITVEFSWDTKKARSSGRSR